MPSCRFAEKLRRGCKSICVVAIVCVVLGVALVYGAVFYVVAPAVDIVNAIASRSWPTTDGRITSSKVVSNRPVDPASDDPTTYHAAIEYVYWVDRETHQGKRVSFNLGDDPDLVVFPFGYFRRSVAERIVDRYPVGKTVNVYYNPAKPGTAVLEPGKCQDAWKAFPGILVGILLTVGLLGWLVGVVRARVAGIRQRQGRRFGQQS